MSAAAFLWKKQWQLLVFLEPNARFSVVLFWKMQDYLILRVEKEQLLLVSTSAVAGDGGGGGGGAVAAAGGAVAAGAAASDSAQTALFLS